ncbi:hypothetical protein FX988_02926 [Paraglaciecola mesophila]|uniref:Uncharacterized protein n=1 Tax=Paraglaciecola mesophila TaxID=197222 RepID=A0A857JMU7_9ALTE|nr:hypothetical protein [Paraglaciecola mesophila]QHJ12668.1 hypothetical protein FX988_02926 [Paraglaciecola mesophila]
MQHFSIWLLYLLTIAPGMSWADSLPNSLLKTEHTAHKHYIGVHGMALLFAQDGSAYGHHLPLYSPPHDYQIVYQLKIVKRLSANLLKGQPNEASKPISPLKRHGLLTIKPDPFDLRLLVKGDTFKVKATVYQGHFERGGEALFTSEITFVKPIYREKIALEKGSQPRFVPVKLNESETLILHQITSRPSFDVIWLTHDQSAQPKQVTACIGISEIKEENGYDWQRTFQYLSHCFAPPAYLEVQDFAQ